MPVGVIDIQNLVDFWLECWSYLEAIRFNISGFQFSLADVFVSTLTVNLCCIMIGNLIAGGLGGGYDVEY